MKRITVLLAEDHAIVREGLRALLEMEDDFEVVGEADNGLTAVALTQELRPAVVVMDLAMPQLNGLEAARRIRQQSPTTKLLVLSAHDSDTYLEQVAELGVEGYLIKQSTATMLAKAIRTIHRGKRFFGPDLAQRLRGGGEQPGSPRRAKRGLSSLTTREREVLQRVAEGEANKQVAANLSISTKTVEKHRQSVMNKLGIHDTAGLTRYAIAAGIVESGTQTPVI